MFLYKKGRDWGSIVNWDDLGKLYAILIVLWTSFLLTGIIWLIVNRSRPFIRIRNLPLAISSTCFLHIYLVKIFLAYTTNGHFTCSAEFWIMSIYLPFGIALYQAYLVQLRSCWERQQRLVSSTGTTKRSWKTLSAVQRSYCIIALGMLIQLIVTAVLYATSPVLQGDWKSFGKVTHAKGQALCRKSPQWIPSAFWQLAWSWLYGPYILFKTRHIRDTHYWKLQIIISVIAGLPGTPLWLAALYSVKFKPVNIRWVPPMWLAPGIIVMQFVTIFFPMYEAWQSKREMQDTLSLLRAWDIQTSDHTSPSTAKSSTSMPSPESITRINTMASLRKALSINAKPLLEFAATQDFSAENVLFLIRVRQWKALWPTTPREHLFKMGVIIYRTLVNDKTAEFPINLEHKIRIALDEMFSSAIIEDNDEHPQFGSISTHNRAALVHTDSSDSAETLWEKEITPMSKADQIFDPHPGVRPLGELGCVVKEDFNEEVFNAAEKSIEYLVLTNTWQRFVKMGNARRISEEL